MLFLEDGYIVGIIRPAVGKCPLCKNRGRVIDIAQVTMPVGYTVEATILWDRKDDGHLHRAIGLTCGCYAKFHRQVAHINDSRMRAGATV